MKAGNLRHRVAIQVKTDVIDGTGSTNMTWADVSGMSSVPAAIWPVKSKERIEAMKLESVATHKIRIRYRSGITSKNRILFGARIFEIKGQPINQDEKNIILDILVTEIV